MSLDIRQILNLLKGRFARNIYVWVFLMWVVFNINGNNEKIYHYGAITSSWYIPFIIIGFITQMVLIYVNNLVLVPRLLAKKKYLLYFVTAFIHLAAISFIYTIWVKTANTHFDISNIQQAAFVTSPMSKEWTAEALLDSTISFMFSNIFWLLVFTMAWYMNNFYRQQKIAEDAAKKQTETELNFLKSQVNPHFLFNTLNNLYGLALKKADNTPDAILKLSSIMRYVLYESNADKVAYEKEKEVMQAYIELELLRLTNTKGLHFTISADSNNYLIPPLLWMPVLENMFKHGTRLIDDNLQGAFTFVLKDNELTIGCVNSFKEIPDNKQGGIGLANLRKRLELLYPNKYTIKETKENGQYNMDLKIQL